MSRSRINPQIFSLVAISLLAHVTLSGGRVASSLFVLQTGHAEFVAGLTYGLYGLMPALLALHVGRLVDRVGPRRIMLLSLFVMVLGLVLPALHLSLASVLFCAALGGLGFSGYILAGHAAVSMMEVAKPSDRTGMFAWLQMGPAVSAVIGPFLVGLIIDHQSYTIAYLCLTGIVACGLLWSFQASIPEGLGQKKGVGKSTLLRDVISDHALLRIYLLSMAVYLAWDSFAFMIPVLGTARGYSASFIGIILSFFAAGTFIVRALQPWLSERSTEWFTLRVAYALSAAVFLGLTLADSLVLLCALSLVFGIAAGVGHPNIQNLLLRYVDASKSGEASGLRLMTGNLAGMLGTTACGAVTALAGVLPVFLGIAAVMSFSSWQSQGERISDHRVPKET